MPEEKMCSQCKHAIFSNLWGEYKCKKFSHRIANIYQAEYCSEYIKSPNNEIAISKRDDEYF